MDDANISHKGKIIWRPSEDYEKKSNIKRFMDKHDIKDYEELLERSTKDIEWFWDACLKDLGLEWFVPYERILDMSGGFPWARWFIGGKINIVHNCLDRHANSVLKDKTALIWEPDSGDARELTYGELYLKVNRVANALRSFGIRKGDCVGIYMPMVPEIVMALMACFKIGAIAIPVFSGFGAVPLAARLNDAEAKLLFTADGFTRRGKRINLKKEADIAAEMYPHLEKVVVLQRLGVEIPLKEGRDYLWNEVIPQQSENCPTYETDSEDICMIIYTSGTTGRPKGTVHTHAGCLAQMSKELGYYFDVKTDDTFFWLTDIGWMMGPWEMIGVQFFGGTYVIFEGAPDYPKPDRLWDMIERHGITILGISPTAIRVLVKYGVEQVRKHNLKSLRILGSTGEPWDYDSYMWYFQEVGDSRCPVINISGGTEIVGCLLSPLPIMPLKPCTLGGPGLGMDVDVFNEEGKPVRGGIGYLVCKKPAPSMTKGFLKDPERYLETYFSKWENIWYHGDWAHIDDDGYWFLHGRADDTIKVGGKRVGPAEIESILIEHPPVSEAACIGVPHEVKGEGIVCFVVLKPGIDGGENLREELKEIVSRSLGKALRPEEVKFVTALPKTRSAKIVRGIIKRKFLGMDLGDVSSVENLEAIEEIGKAL